jgi:hypothetical protein
MVYLSKPQEKRKVLEPYYLDDKLTIKIYDKEYLLLDLMLKYFFSNVKDYTSMSVKRKKKTFLRIPINHITFNNEVKMPDHTYISYRYNVSHKVTNANARSIDMITEYDVVYALHQNDFKCRYCGMKLNPKNWHLEHVIPLANSGKNQRENLAGACKMCNTMKHAFREEDFLLRCEKIYKYHQEKVDSIKEYQFKISTK